MVRINNSGVDAHSFQKGIAAIYRASLKLSLRVHPFYGEGIPKLDSSSDQAGIGSASHSPPSNGRNGNGDDAWRNYNVKNWH
jgi:hypothetical protein